MHWRHVSITTTPCWGSRLVALRAHVLLAERIGAHPLSQCAHPGQLGGEACRGLPSECMLGDGFCLVWPPTPRGRPSVTSYAYGLFKLPGNSFTAFQSNIQLLYLCSCTFQRTSTWLLPSRRPTCFDNTGGFSAFYPINMSSFSHWNKGIKSSTYDRDLHSHLTSYLGKLSSWELHFVGSSMHTGLAAYTEACLPRVMGIFTHWIICTLDTWRLQPLLPLWDLHTSLPILSFLLHHQIYIFNPTPHVLSQGFFQHKHYVWYLPHLFPPRCVCWGLQN